MTHGHRRSRPPLAVVTLFALASLLAACGSSSATASPSTSIAPSSSNAPSVAPTAPATIAPSPTAAPTATPTPTTAPSASSAGEACAIVPQTGRLPSDRMTDVRIDTSGSADVITFVFGNMSVPEPPQGASKGSLETAVPPYTQAGSGATIDVTGDHVAQIRFDGMSLSNDAGELTYDGALEFSPDLPALKALQNYDMSEGVIGWYIGYDGNGCVTLTNDGKNVIVAIDHPAG